MERKVNSVNPANRTALSRFSTESDERLMRCMCCFPESIYAVRTTLVGLSAHPSLPTDAACRANDGVYKPNRVSFLFFYFCSMCVEGVFLRFPKFAEYYQEVYYSEVVGFILDFLHAINFKNDGIFEVVVIVSNGNFFE